jgi:[ribosomal protein S5]-alanine N-acetyltransferase
VQDVSIRKTVGVASALRNRPNVWNLGFWTHPEYQGRGYLTESVLAILEFGFGDESTEDNRSGATQIEAS